jgi:hypothetical protein
MDSITTIDAESRSRGVGGTTSGQFRPFHIAPTLLEPTTFTSVALSHDIDVVVFPTGGPLPGAPLGVQLSHTQLCWHVTGQQFAMSAAFTSEQ